MIEELKAWRTQQAQELSKAGRPADGGHLCLHSGGRECRCSRTSSPTNGSSWSKPLGLPRLRFHDLRHAHATHLLASGVHPKVASERLGHSKVGITLDLYSHVMPGMQEDAVAKVDAAFRAARKPS